MNNNNNNVNNIIKPDDIQFNKMLEQFIKGEIKIKYYLKEDEPKYFKLKSNSDLIEIDRIFTNPTLFYFSILFYFNRDFMKINDDKLLLNNINFDNLINKLTGKNIPNEKFVDFDFLKNDDNDNINEEKKKEFIGFLKQISLNKKMNMNYSKKYNNDEDENENEDKEDENNNDIEENINFYFKSEKEKRKITDLNFFIAWISKQIYSYLINYVDKDNETIKTYKKKKEDIIDIINYYFKNNGEDFSNKSQKFCKQMPNLFLNLGRNINDVINGYIKNIMKQNIYNTIAFINYFSDLDYLNINCGKKIIKNIKYSIFGSKIYKTDSRVISGYHHKNSNIGVENSILFNLVRKYLVFENTKYVNRKITVDYFNINNEKKLEYLVNDFNSGESDNLFHYINKLNDIFIKQFVDVYQSKKLKLIIEDNIILNNNNNDNDNELYITKSDITNWIRNKYPNTFGVNFTMLKCVEFNKLLNNFCIKNKVQYKCRSKFPFKIKNYEFNDNNNNNNGDNNKDNNNERIFEDEINDTNIDEYNKLLKTYKNNINNIKQKLKKYEEGHNKKRKIGEVNSSSETSNDNEQ